VNEDKTGCVDPLCPTCEMGMEVTSGQKKAVCHNCGSQYKFTLVDNLKEYPTKDNPLQQIVIVYDGN
jgi:transposase-like protein